jgi:hypothetical protein
MDSGKTYTASCLVTGLHRGGRRVAAIKLTGTAAGRDTWSLLDAGANPALDFIDGGWPSTYLCTQGELLDLYGLLLGNAAAHGADWVVVEIADGLFQQETAALLRSPAFVETVAAWLFAATDALGAEAGVRTLRGWDIEPLALSGRMSMSPLAMREAAAATGVGCVTARALQQGILNERFPERRAMPERRAE